MLCCLLLLSAAAWAQPSQLHIRPLHNYYLDNKVILKHGLNCMVITTKKDFDKLFGIAKTETNMVDVPDFDKEIVLVLAMPPSATKTTLQFGTIYKAGDFISVACDWDRTDPLTYKMEPILLGALPKNAEVKVVKFFRNKRPVVEVALKTRKN